MTSTHVLTVGRISVDLYADAPGARFEDEQRFVKSIGGSPTNVAVAATRLGHRSAVLTKVGADPFGDYALAALASFGVDTTHVGRDETLATPLAFAALTPPDDPHLVFYRNPSAPDMQLTTQDIDDDSVRDVDLLWVAASAMAEQPARATIERMLAIRARATHTVVDLDYRPTFWRSPEEAGAVIGSAIDGATVAVGNRVECAIAVGSDDPAEAADRLLAAASAWRSSRWVPTASSPRHPAAPSSCRLVPSRSSAASAPATRFGARSSTGCCRVGRPTRWSRTPTPPARSSRHG
ncbi:MAG: PfkB family carbohydrate kinase [Ilumatobacteraceae bacterium]